MAELVAVLIEDKRRVFLRERKNGYQQLYVWVKGKRVALGRYLFDRYVRRLELGEVVHHRDGNSLNCSTLNLYGCDEGLHRQIHTVWRFLERSGDEASLCGSG